MTSLWEKEFLKTKKKIEDKNYKPFNKSKLRILRVNQLDAELLNNDIKLKLNNNFSNLFKYFQVFLIFILIISLHLLIK